MEKVVSKHFLVPKHEVVPKDQEDELIKQLGCEKKLLPQVLAGDPAVLEAGAEKGDIMKITRDSFTAKKSIYFRVVV